ncbi:helix-turn-helix domain-containing protein [Luteimicrobium subarcticum]|uniref:Excisionase family DNA binding protein n=1 Tax=Luteimicrobium subarcticum TaxID=620910 RepID=A0A2M8WJF1_9MICO|nr:helix-turn-helix domain-containing protein [Luteimicrobium subarcticum]PJI91043.1 excisionase family DNA binding protein [Luteimicrobium subarcticum]
MTTDHNATITFDTRDPAGNIDDDILETLTGYSPATGRDERQHVQVFITFPANNLEQAFVIAFGLAARTSLPVLALEVLPTTEFDARNFGPSTKSVTVSEAAEILGITRQAVLQRIKTGALPAEKVGPVYTIPAAALTPPEAG